MIWRPTYRICGNVSQMRAEPCSGSEVVSQALFSEEVRLLDRVNDWVKIETVSDAYAGWTEKGAVCAASESYNSSLGAGCVWINRLSSHLYHTKDTIYGPLLTLPYNSRLVLAEPVKPSERWLKVLLPGSGDAYIQSGDVVFEKPVLSREAVCALSLTFLGIPYTWGGRSSFGYDCSGFVQMLYHEMGVSLQRDSKEQAVQDGFIDRDLKELESGDLLFFGFSGDAIKHVGLSLGGNRFIHTCASVENAPYVRISSLEDPAWNGGGYYPFRLGRTLV